jgi:hypothetical protein
MTPGEKVAAEWEARHDVAARGGHASPAGVQDYLRHRHTDELLGRGTGRPALPATQEPAAPPTPSTPPPPEPAGTARPAPSPAPRWWRRLLRRGPG